MAMNSSEPQPERQQEANIKQILNVDAKQPEESIYCVGAFLPIVPIESLPGGTSVNARGGMTRNIGNNNIPHPSYIKSSIPFTSDSARLSQNRDFSGLFEPQHMGMRPTEYFGHRQGNSINLTDFFKPTNNPLESTFPRQQRSTFLDSDLIDLHMSQDITASPTTYFGQRQGHRIDETDLFSHPNHHLQSTQSNQARWGSSTCRAPNTNMTQNIHSGLHSGIISSITPPHLKSESSELYVSDINRTPAIHSAQHLGNISSITPPNMMNSVSSGLYISDINGTPGTHSGQHLGNISSITPPNMMTSGSSGLYISDINRTAAPDCGPTFREHFIHNTSQHNDKWIL
jgi:hypothetical protein